MFSVKATYHGETRKFSFNSTSFPTFDQLYSQLYRIFPSGNNYYLSKLLFCPNAAHPARILIAQEIHTADDYDKCLLPYSGRSWTNGLLRFSVHDETFHRSSTKPEVIPPTLKATDFWVSSHSPISAGVSAQPQTQTTSPPISSFYIPPPPIMFSTAPRAHSQASLDVDSIFFDVSNQNPYPSYLENRPMPPPLYQTKPNETKCCSLAQSKAEIETLLHSFKQDLDRILNRTFGRSFSFDQMDTNNVHQIKPTPPIPPLIGHLNNPSLRLPNLPLFCSSCAAPAVGPWYTCSKCCALVCAECNIRGKYTFCTLALGPHTLELAAPMNVPPRNGNTFSGPLFSPPSWAVPPGPYSHRTAETFAPPLLYNDVIDPFRYSTATPPVEPFIPPTRILSPEMNFSHSVHPASVTSQPAPPPPPPPPPVIHQGIACNICKVIIEGVRHKCLDCTDYDLCSVCISSELHNPRHKFLDITEPTRVIVHTVYDDDARERVTLDHVSPVPVPAPVAIEPPVYHNATCDMCDSRIFGDRYKCTTCPDFDTCSACFSITSEQHPKHSFVKLSKPDTYIRRDVSPPVSHMARCNACNKNIVGVRYKCMHPLCPDVDLCADCEALPIPQHPDNHPMLKMKTSETVIPTVYRLGQTSALERLDSPRSRMSTPPLSQSPVYECGYMHNPLIHPTPNRSPSRSHSPAISLKYSVQQPFTRSPSPVVFETKSPYTSNIRPRSVHLPQASRPNSFRRVSHISPASQQESPIVCSLFEGPSHHTIPSPLPCHQRPLSPSSSCSNLQSPVTSTNGDHSLPSPCRWADPVNYALSPHLPPVLRSPTIIWNKFTRPRCISFDTERDTGSPYATPEEPLSNLPQSPGEPSPAPVIAKPTAENQDNATAFPPLDSSWFGLHRGLSNLAQEHISRTATESSHGERRTSNESISIANKQNALESPLNNEALLNRPSIMNTPPMQVSNPQIVTSNNRSLSALLSSYRPTSNLISPVPEDSTPTVSGSPQHTVVEPLSAGFIQDVTVPDGQIFAPGVAFVKCWRLINDGTRDWPEFVELVFVAGTSFAGDVTSPPIDTVKAGEYVNIWTPELKAPDVPGKYVSYWRLRDDKGQLFGDSIWIDIEIIEPNRHSVDELLSSSSVIVMPDLVSHQPPVPAPHSDRNSARASIAHTYGTSDDGISDTSSVSLVSVPSSDDDDDAALWADSRAQATAEYVSQAMEYVLLYDDNTSSEED